MSAQASAAPSAVPGTNRRIPIGLIAAAASFLLLRGLILYTAFDRVSLWMFELFPMGTVAELHRRGIEFPVRYYYDNAAGQILAGWLAVPCFGLFGSTYLALKMVPLALGFGTLVLVWIFLDQNFSRRAANLGAWLFAIAPPTLVKYSVICSGNHFENLFFTMAAVVCAFALHRRPESRGWLLASAFTAGFALFVFLGALIPLGVLAGMHVGLRGIRRTLRDLVLVVPAFALGILPLVILNASTGARGLGFLGAKFGQESAPADGALLERLGHFLTVHLPAAGVFEPIAGLSREALGGLYLAAFTLAYLACLPGAFGGVLGLLRGALRPETARFESVRLVPIVLVLPLSALAFGMSNFKILVYAPPLEVAGYRYFLPILLFAILAIAVVADRWWERGGAARVGAVLVYAPALLGGLTSLAIVDWTFSRPNLGAYYDGYDLSKLARGLLSTRNALEPAEIRSRLQSFPPAVRGKVTRAIGFNLGVFLIEKKGLAGALESVVPEILDTYPASAREDLACGVGIAARFHVAISGAGECELLDGLDRSWGAWPENATGGGDAAERLALVRGACLRNPALPLAEQTRSILEPTHALLVRRVASDPADPLGLAFASGQGHLCGRLARRGIPADLASVRDEALRILELSPAYAGSFWEGAGAGWVEEREPAEPFDALRGIPGFDADRAASGAGRGVARVHREATEAAARAWRDSIAPAERPEFDEGLRLGLAESGG